VTHLHSRTLLAQLLAQVQLHAVDKNAILLMFLGEKGYTVRCIKRFVSFRLSKMEARNTQQDGQQGACPSRPRQGPGQGCVASVVVLSDF